MGKVHSREFVLWIDEGRPMFCGFAVHEANDADLVDAGEICVGGFYIECDEFLGWSLGAEISKVNYV